MTNEPFEYEGEEMSVRHFFRHVLKSILIDEPPKRLTNSYSDWLWKFKEGLIKTGHAKGIINRCDCGTISDSWCNDTPCYEAVYDDAQMDKDIEGLINEALKD